MGCNASAQQSPKDKAVSDELEQDKDRSNKIHKLLLLGAGNSGKSTFFKQLTQIHGSGFSTDDKKHAIQYIYDAILDQMKAILHSAMDRQLDFKSLNGGSLDLSDSKEFILKLQRDIRITQEIANHIEILWACEDIQTVFNERTNLGIVDSSPYFFENIQRISEDEYLPTVDDILLARIPTTGIREASFMIEQDIFEIYDVGGQRSERNKWIHCFELVHAVLFVVSLSCYDQQLYEEAEINAMEEGLELWENVANSPYFRNKRTSMLIFFNKVDLFREKIKHKSLSLCWPDYDGQDGDLDYALDWIHKRFLEQVDDPDRNIYTHVTCATDRANVQRVFHDVQHGVVVGALAKNGIL